MEPKEMHRQLKRYNVSFFFTWNKDTEQHLAKAPQLFRKVYKNYRISVWQVMGHDFRFLANDEIKIKDFYFSPGEIRWVINNPVPDNRITAAVAFHPNWSVYIDGKKGKITETSDHMISFTLHRRGEQRITLEFHQSPQEYAYYFLSFATLAFVICVMISYLPSLTGKWPFDWLRETSSNL
jgi:hypothetical protein